MTRTLLLSLLWSVCALAQQHPLPVESSSLLERGHAQLDMGTSYFMDQPFPLSGLTGHLLKFGTLRFAVSLSEYVELQADGTILNLLDVTKREPAFNSRIASNAQPTGDIGDFTVWTKFAVLSEYTTGIGFSVRFGVQLPNASNESGLGIDEMNFYSLLLFERHIGGLLTANAGLGILSDPTVLGQQHDVFLYGLQYTLPVASSTSLVLQTAGRRGHSGPAMHHLSNIKAGIEHGFGDLTLKAYGVSNISEFDHAKGAELSVAYLFHAITMQ
ncbi:MAG: hypothetical protein HUU02_01810 [Bacteroidetes bacterium]|nr:hypothetical protein [Bacteroidota bacterium]